MLDYPTYKKSVQHDSKENKEKKKPFWITRIMAEEFDRETVLESTLRETIIFAIFVTIVTIVCVGMLCKSMFYLTRVMEQQFIDKEFTTVNDVTITFDKIRTANDFWYYTQSVLLDNFYSNSSNNEELPSEDSDAKSTVLMSNKLIGIPRLRQLKVRNDSCLVHRIFRRTFSTCFASYSKQAEDTATFGPGNGSAWIYNTAQQTGSLEYRGKISNYDGSGFYQDLSQSKDINLKIINNLKTNLWITQGTRAIFTDFTVFNVNTNLFCIMKLVFEFPPTGGIFTSYDFHSVKLLRYTTSWDHFVLACEILFLGFILFYTCEEIREIVYLRLRYFSHFWNYIDVTILTLAFCAVFFGIVRYFYVEEKLKTLEGNSSDEQYENFETVCSWQLSFNSISAILLFFVYIKVFKYFNFNRTMGQLNNTFKKCALDVLSFSVMFFIIFFAFALLGYLLFGTQVDNFSGFGVAMFTLLRTILGDFDYTEIEKANKLLAPVYFISYIFFVFFVLLNMFLAIINDTYSDVKTEFHLAPEEMQMTEFIKRGFYNFLKKCGCTKIASEQKIQKNEYSITVEKIRGLLKMCGYTDLEIEMFFARYDIDPTVDVADFDLNKLIADLEETPKERGKKYTNLNEQPAAEDLLLQEERLNEMETIINLLANKLDMLLKKLDTMDNVRKISKSK